MGDNECHLANRSTCVRTEFWFFFSNCQGFVLIPQNVLRLLVSCVIKIKVKGREWCMICTINKVGSAHIFVWYKKWPNLGSATVLCWNKNVNNHCYCSKTGDILGVLSLKYGQFLKKYLRDVFSQKLPMSPR